MSDVGAKAAAKSGGLLQVAECNLGNPERDCNQLLVKKLRLALPVEKSILGSFRHIPILKMRSWFDFFTANSCMHILHGLHRPHAAREEAICTAFWQNYRRLHPEHRIFHEASQGNLLLERALPLLIHGDEGRGRRHCSHFVMSFHSILGLGFGKKKNREIGQKWNATLRGTPTQIGFSLQVSGRRLIQTKKVKHGKFSWSRLQWMLVRCGKPALPIEMG